MNVGSWLVKKLGAPINTSAAIILGMYTLLWGLWVVNPCWNAFETARLYSALLAVLPEFCWGIFACIVGLTMCYGIVRNSYKSVARGAWAGFIHWFIIAGGYFIGDWQNTGGITAAMICVYCGFVYLNLRVNRDNLRFENDQDNIKPR